MARHRDPMTLRTDPRLSGLFVADHETMKALVASMRDEGYREGHPIEVWERGRSDLVVVDGHTRRDAAIMAGLGSVPIVAPRGIKTIDDAFAYAVRGQRLRRNLTGDALVAFVLRVLVRNDQPVSQGQRTDVEGGWSARELAGLCGCSETTVVRARRLLREGDQELVGQVFSGKISLLGAIRKLAARTEAPDPVPQPFRARPEPEEAEPTDVATPTDDADTLVWDLRQEVDGLCDLVQDARRLPLAKVATRLAEQIERARAALDELERLSQT